MRKKNSDIIDEVRKSVGSKTSKVKNFNEKELPDDSKEKDMIKSIVEDWLEKNAKGNHERYSSQRNKGLI